MTKKKKIVIGSSIVGILIILLACSLVWVYTGNFTNAKANILSKAKLPVAMVGDNLVSADDITERFKLAEKIEGADPNFSKNAAIGKIVDRIVEDRKMQIIAKSNQVTVTDQEVNDELKRIVGITTKGDQELFEKKLMETYGMSLKAFRSQVITPDLLKVNIGKWFYSQRNLNEASYKKLDEIQGKLANSEFVDLAKQYSEDEATKQFGGDNGFIKIDEMIPELQEKLRNKPSGEIVTATSRYGIHIMKIAEVDAQDSSRIHIFQIFLKGSDLAEWVKKQTDSLRIIKLISYK